MIFLLKPSFFTEISQSAMFECQPRWHSNQGTSPLWGSSAMPWCWTFGSTTRSREWYPGVGSQGHKWKNPVTSHLTKKKRCRSLSNLWLWLWIHQMPKHSWKTRCPFGIPGCPGSPGPGSEDHRLLRMGVASFCAQWPGHHRAPQNSTWFQGTLGFRTQSLR